MFAGVGFFANDNPAPNNSAVLADTNNEIGTLYCSSGSRTMGIGRWFLQNGTEITTNDGGSFTVVHGGGNFPAYAGLQLRTGKSFIADDEGVYTCTIPDDAGVQQTLYVGIYRYGYYGEQYSMLQCGHYFVTVMKHLTHIILF